MILVDTNALILLLIGLIDVRLISTHKRTSIYDEQDFYDLQSIIQPIDKLVVLPNIWTEVDNLLNRFEGAHRYSYIQKITEIIKSTSEKFLESSIAAEHIHF